MVRETEDHAGSSDITPGPRVRITLPQDWEQVPVDPEEYATWVSERLEEADISRGSSQPLLTALRSVLVEARGEGLVLAGAYLDVLENEDDASVGGAGNEVDQYSIVGATLSVIIRPAGQLEGVLSPFAWEAALRESEAQGNLSLIRQPELTVVGPYDAVKAVVLDEIPADEHFPAVSQLAVDYYASIDNGRAMLILGFRTPCTWLQEEFEPLFDVIAESLRIDEDLAPPTE